MKKSRNTTIHKLKIALISFLALGAAACSDRTLTRGKGSTNIASEGTFCLAEPDGQTIYTKFLFVVDKSGSNGTTDPSNIRRAQNIEAFYNAITSQPDIAKYVKWGIIEFHQDGARALIKNGQDQPVFTSDPAQVSAGLQGLRAQDAGSTPYRAALGLTKTAISYDLQQTAKTEPNSLYMIVFMSDGRPTDYGSETVAGPSAFADVREILKLSPGKVKLSTAYYGPPDPPAAEGLKQMAEIGKGKFMDVNTDGNFAIEDLIEGGEATEPYVMRSLLVYNVNSAICFDKSYGVDSDGDGLCDIDEATLKRQGVGNFDPKNRYSFNDAYNDYIHYIAKKTGSTLRPCDPAIAFADDDFDLLNRCEEAYMQNTDAMRTLNRMDADYLNPDTDRDGIIDGIEYLTLRDKSSPIDQLNLFRHYDTDVDDAYLQISSHRNPAFPDSGLKAENTYDTKWEYVGLNDLGQRCYSFSQKYLKTYNTLAVNSSKTLPYLGHAADENVILIYYIQTPENDPIAKSYYKYSFQKLSGNAAEASRGTEVGLKIGDQYMKTYSIPSPAGEPTAYHRTTKESGRYVAGSLKQKQASSVWTQIKSLFGF